jgi:hypothetical protein
MACFPRIDMVNAESVGVGVRVSGCSSSVSVGPDYCTLPIPRSSGWETRPGMREGR